MRGLLLPTQRLLVGFLIIMLALVALISSPIAAQAVVAPVQQREATGVTADGLPTVQIDGVVWDQEIVGNTVYAGGQFAYARPAGAALGAASQVPRSNLLAYDIRTGELITSFNPNLNGQVKSITASPDGKRIYVGGSFTTVTETLNGVTKPTVNRYRLAAFNTSDGSLVTTFAPSLNAGVNAIAVTNTAVYVGGPMTAVGSVARPHLAAFSPTNGALLGWAPNVPDGGVNAMVAAPDGSRIIVGGSFSQLNTTTATGLGAIDATTGATMPFAANETIHNYGSSSAIVNLSTDGENVYGTGYWYGGTGNFEGVFATDPNSGVIRWLADCHGDTYDASAVGDVVYSVSHWHYCSNIGGFPDTNPRSVWYRSNAVTVDAKGTVAPNGQGGYANFQDKPAPALINWFPQIDSGTYTGQSQGGWTTEGNKDYVVQGGEFPKVNGVAQQGLVRFAVPSLAPNKQGPRISGTAEAPSLLDLTNGSVKIKWQTNWDRDDQVLSYDVQREGVATPIYTTTATSQFWNRPFLSFTDTTTQAGKTYRYRITAYDAAGNRVTSSYVSVIPTATNSPYYAQVVADGAVDYWRMGNTGSFPDYIGDLDLTGGTGTTTNVGGALNGESDGSATFDGTANGTSGAATTIVGPNTFSAEAWFNTTTTSGGKILGFGDSQLGVSSNYDRQIYMANDGRVLFGVYNGGVRTAQSTKTYNDGQWHHVVASLSSAGMVLYVDGLKVGANAATTVGQPFTGRWRVGGDNLNAWPSASSSNFFAGSIDEVAIYPTALSASTIRDHYTKSGRTVAIPVAPKDAYGTVIYADNPAFYWRLDDAAGSTTIKDVSPSMEDGQASGDVAFGTASPVTTGSTAARFSGTNGTVASKSGYSNPSTYSEELWFSTTSTSGGKLIGFGDTQSGTSSNYDRHVFMDNDGKLTFGTWTGFANTITTSKPYNDGKWHHLVATQSADGMKLFLDGQLSGTNPQTQAQGYNGYWRVGGDSSWCCQNFFNGNIDEVAVYDVALDAAKVRSHYDASPAAVNTPPTAAFSSTCDSGSCTFDSSGTGDVDGTVATYAWDFGDGQTSTEASPTHGYDASGTYNVVLTVTDNKGATGTVQHAVQVTVPPVNQPPTAAWTNTCNELDCTFDGSTSSDPDGSIDTYRWTFGDSTTASIASPTHTYSADGTYTVSLTVTDNRGATATTSRSVVVKANVKPVAAFTTSCVDLTCGFNSSGSSDPDGQITAFAWNFSDGSTESTDANPSHTFDTAGTYDVKLTVKDDHGATTSKTTATTVTVNAKPKADFSTGCSALTCAPDGSASSDADGGIVSYSWTFGDGTPAVSGKVPPAHTYDNPGTYALTLLVTDDDGATDSKTTNVTVALPPNQVPSATIANDCTGLVCTFDGSGSSDPDGSLVAYAWDFGDGTSADVAKPSHTYASTGTYTVKLTVTDNRGASASTTKSLTFAANNQPPVAAFTFTTNGLTASFDASTSSDPDGTVATYAWDFGNGTGSGKTPTRTYSTAGSYSVKLIVTDDKGASTSITKAVTVSAANQAPTASFTQTSDGLVMSVDASGSSDADGSISAYAWDFGDGSQGTGRTTTKTYTSAGTYTIRLTVTDDDGATGTTNRTVTVAAASAAVAKDNFDRTATRWGSADTGGPWTYSGSTYSTNGRTGDVTIAAKGAQATASLTGVSARDVDVTTSVAVDKVATGGGFQTTLVTRKTSNGDYRMTLTHLANGSARLNLTKVVNGTATSLRDANVTAATYKPGSVLLVRFTVKGNGTTALSGKVWKEGTSEPATAQINASDSTAVLQVPGSFAITSYVSGTATNAPVKFSLDNLLVAAI